MSEIKTGVPYEGKVTIIPSRVGMNIFGEKVVIDDKLKAWPLDQFDSFERFVDRDAKRRRAAVEMIRDYVDGCDHWEVEAAWESLFDDEADDDDVEAVIEFAKQKARELAEAEGVEVEDDDE